MFESLLTAANLNGQFTLTGVYANMAPIPTARYGAAACVHNGNIYVFGGNDSNNDINTFYRYSVIDNTWTALATGPGTRRGATLTAVGDNLYLIGGSNNNGQVWRYNVAANSWVEIITNNTKALRFYHAAVEHGGNIYLFGGFNGSTQLNDIQRYVIANNTFVQMVNLPNVNHGLIGDVVGNTIYLFGGSVGNEYQNTLLAYNVLTNTISSISAPGAPSARAFCVIGVVNNKLYIHGGLLNDKTTIVDQLWEYIPGQSIWTQLPGGGTARYASSGAVINREFYVIGGRPTATSATTLTTKIT